MRPFSPPPSLAHPGTLFDPTPSPSPTPTSQPSKFSPRGLSKRTLIIMIAALSAAALFVLAFGAVHRIRHRARLHHQRKEQQDIEKSLRLAQRARLARDSDVPARPNEIQRSASMPQVPMRAADAGVPALPPLVPVRTAPPVLRTYEVVGPVERIRSPTRSPLGSHPPGVSGRVASRVRQIEEV